MAKGAHLNLSRYIVKSRFLIAVDDVSSPPQTPEKLHDGWTQFAGRPILARRSTLRFFLGAGVRGVGVRGVGGSVASRVTALPTRRLLSRAN